MAINNLDPEEVKRLARECQEIYDQETSTLLKATGRDDCDHRFVVGKEGCIFCGRSIFLERHQL